MEKYGVRVQHLAILSSHPSKYTSNKKHFKNVTRCRDSRTAKKYRNKVGMIT